MIYFLIEEAVKTIQGNSLKTIEIDKELGI